MVSDFEKPKFLTTLISIYINGKALFGKLQACLRKRKTVISHDTYESKGTRLGSAYHVQLLPYGVRIRHNRGFCDWRFYRFEALHVALHISEKWF